MKLSPEQLAKVRHWAESGESLSNIQKLMETELSLRMTYMDVRFLIDDLGIELGSKAPAPKKQEEKKSAPATQSAAEEIPAEEAAEDEAEEMELSGAVQVEADVINRPGTVLSGSVTFSDGTKAKWYLDQMGRLGLDGVDKGYRPSAEDVQDFQMELQKILQKKGY